MAAIPTGVRGQHGVVVMSISLMMSDDKHLCRYLLAICRPSLTDTLMGDPPDHEHRVSAGRGSHLERAQQRADQAAGNPGLEEDGKFGQRVF